MKDIVSLVLILIAIGMVSENVQAQFKWHGNAKAAVCFTYDDGLDCHLDVAVPQLDEFGFKGTFYATGNSPSLYKRMDEWRQIVRNGHELGNHTLFHPCDGQRFDWVKPEYDLNNYTMDRLMSELQAANSLLKAIDGKEQRTYAYTCGDYIAGGEDFSGEIQPLFRAARGAGEMAETMDDYNIYNTPSWMVEDHSAEEMIAFVKEAKTRGTVAVFMFHSVGGGYLNVDAGEHRKLLEYLKQHQDEYYIGTFMEVTEYIRGNRK
jgi:peptidoglycan-N-acetylglucosamine deacetylase